MKSLQVKTRIVKQIKTKFKNGLVLLTETLPNFESLAIGVWVRAGTRHETSDESGMSHFLEHLMFKGTQKRSALEIAHSVDRVGGDFNAFTSREYTCFHILLLAKDLRLGIDLLSDIILNSTFDELEIERERKVILQEILMAEDTPEEYLYDLFYEQAFGGHPLGLHILGSRKRLNKFKRTDVVRFFKKHYAPRNIVISVCGNVLHEQVQHLVDKHLIRPLTTLLKHKHRMKKQKVPGSRAPVVHTSSKFIKREIEQAQIILGFPFVKSASRQHFAAHLINVHLGGGMSSVLFQEIREKRGLAYSVYSSISSFSDVGLFSIYMAIAQDQIRNCLEVTAGEIHKLRLSLIEEKKLETLKENLKGTIKLNADSVESRMITQAKNEIWFGRNFTMDEVCRAIDQVTASDIQKLALQYFQPKTLILTLMADRKPSGLFEFVKKRL